MGATGSVPQQEPMEGIAYIVLCHLDDYRDIVNAWQVCKSWGALSRSEEVWKMLCGRLSESLVHVASVAPPSACGPAWRVVFMDAWKSGFAREHLGRPLPARACDSPAASAPEAAAKHGLPIRVCVRFRAPSSSSEVIAASEEAPAGAGAHAHGGKGSVLPLHQRLQLLKMRHGCSASEAQRRVWGAAGAGDPWSESEPREASSRRENRGAAEESTSAGGEASTSAAAEASTSAGAAAAGLGIGLQAAVLSVQPRGVLMMAPTVGLRQFDFDAVLDRGAKQSEAYAAIASQAVASFLNGENAAVMCYGQTGSGKTHTVSGADAAAGCSLRLTPRSGLAPRAAREIIDSLARRASRFALEWGLAVSYVEIYGDEVTDLLRGGARVGAWAGVAARAVDAGLAEVEIQSAEQLEDVLRRGDAAKRRAATAMNERSSRAHALLIFSLRMRPPLPASAPPPPEGAPLPTDPDPHPWLHSKLYLVDLGGSEKVHKSGASADSQRMAEAVRINLGLLALRNCITALVDGEAHVPFNTSRLTQLMQGAFLSQGGSAPGGTRSRAVVAVTCRLDPAHAQETLQSLRFGEDAARVVVGGAAGGMRLAASGALGALDAQIEALAEAIRREERWEGGRPVGAEAARAQYEALLAAKRALLEGDDDEEQTEQQRGAEQGGSRAASSGGGSSAVAGPPGGGSLRGGGEADDKENSAPAATTGGTTPMAPCPSGHQ